MLCNGLRLQSLFLRALSEGKVSLKPPTPSIYFFSNCSSPLRCTASDKPAIFETPKRNMQFYRSRATHNSNHIMSRKISSNRQHSAHLHPLDLVVLLSSGQSQWFWEDHQNASLEPMPWQSPSCVTNTTHTCQSDNRQCWAVHGAGQISSGKTPISLTCHYSACFSGNSPG